METVADERGAEVSEGRDHWFSMPTHYRDGETGADQMKVRPGTTPTRVQIEVPHTCEVELIDLRRALRLAEEGNR